jgi:hypothetical protein
MKHYTFVAVRSAEHGMAMVAVLVVLMLVAGMIAGFTTMVITEQRVQRTDRDRVQAFYAAHAGLEQATADLGLLFAADFSPSASQINAVTANPPALAGVTFPAASDGAGYRITFTPDARGNPTANQRTVSTGPYAGLVGLVTPYTITVNARTLTGGEAQLQRTLETVAIPVFQFGIFSETDLSFFAGPDFNFGGRVHTNGHLFLASGATLTLADKVTAVGEVIRTNLSNGWPVSTGYTGTVRAVTSPGTYRALATSEGSLVGTIGSARNDPRWTNLSIGTYNGNLRSGRTGARRLDLPLITIGSSPVEMIRRPATGEVSSSSLFGQRLFGQASLRILLADTEASITALPTVTPAAPVELGAALPGWFEPSATRPPLAVSKAEAGNVHMTTPGSPIIGGYIKVEIQVSAGAWQDVTQELLSLGVGAANFSRTGCADPSPDAVIRVQRVRDVPSTGGSCGTSATLRGDDSWPLTLYDTREGNLRDDEATSGATVYLGGVMHYVELDMRNLRRWILGQIGSSGPNAINTNGITVYFSDRRTNQDAAGRETGEYGQEDVVNAADVNGTPNGRMDAGEDVNANGGLDTYGRVGRAPSGMRVAGWANNTPETAISALTAQVNPPLFFRRALKLTNGAAGNIVSPGLTVASENPVYIEGNFNAGGGFSTHVATAVIADAVTLLSNNWNDTRSFARPHDPGGRPGSETWFRVAIIAGKGMSFPHPAWSPQDFGTDGGVHNFLRLLERWDGTLHYLGSLGSFYFNRQAVGVYKCCTNVYSPPGTRDFAFDIDFLTPSLLPPSTPVFRDLNTLGFNQIFRTPQ